MTIKLSIVVPVYRSQGILAKLVEEVERSMEIEGLIGQFELLLVNDASPDESWQVISDLAASHDFVRGISLRKNFGQHNATMAGLNHARGKIVIIMDDDLQHPPTEIGNLMREIDKGADVCYTRYKGRQHALWKILGSRFNDMVATLVLDKPKGLYLSSFKAIRQEVVQEVIKYDGPYAYLDGLILEVTRAIKVIDIDHQPRHEGVGNYNLKRSVSLWLKMATSFSVFPLRVATVFGFSLTALSLLVISVILVQKLQHPEWPAGWASLIATILFVGGVQTFCVGMLGEYLGRAYLKINGKPQFVVNKTTWSDKNTQ
jgi:undecaprenyl-phosphate 4-deoxy-4-formamido-L-arabinose transferase